MSVSKSTLNDASRNAFLFACIGTVALVSYTYLKAINDVVAYLAVCIVCVAGYRVEARIFRYARHGDLLVRLAFASVMAIAFLSGYLYMRGFAWWIVFPVYAVFATLYHYWLLKRAP